MNEPLRKMTWSDAMSVGIPEIDEDHRLFILLMNRFDESVADRMDLTEIRKRLQAILDYAERHFRDEGRLFAEWGYPDAAHYRSARKARIDVNE